MYKIKKGIIENDFLSQEFLLKFDNEGNDHKTFSGGICSVIITIIMIIYMVI